MATTSEKRVTENRADSKDASDKKGAEKTSLNISQYNISQYFRDSIAELKKVHSPTRAETIQATMVTLAIMIFVALILFCLDMVFRTLMDALLA